MFSDKISKYTYENFNEYISASFKACIQMKFYKNENNLQCKIKIGNYNWHLKEIIFQTGNDSINLFLEVL